MSRSSEITDADNIESQSLASHVAMCRMRHEDTLRRIGRIEYATYVAAASFAIAAGKVLIMSPEAIIKIGAMILKGA